jgi:hypothetical protein
MTTTERKLGKSQRDSRPYPPLEIPTEFPHFTQAQLNRQSLETRIAAQREQQAADRAHERRTGYRPPRQS